MSAITTPVASTPPTPAVLREVAGVRLRALASAFAFVRGEKDGAAQNAAQEIASRATPTSRQPLPPSASPYSSTPAPATKTAPNGVAPQPAMTYRPAHAAIISPRPTRPSITPIATGIM
ncbi:hypothetical protein ACFQXA_06735 [Nocardiopsis composta]